VTKFNAAFKAWFGKSKVVDAEGEPLRVYHGTPTPCFDTFNPESIYSGEGASQSGSGFYFTDNPSSASNYAIMKEGSGAVYPVYLSIKNPIKIDFMKGEVSGYGQEFSRAEIRAIMKMAPDIKDPSGPLSNWGDISFEGYDKVFNEALDLYYKSQSLTSLRNDLFGYNQGEWLRALSLATKHDGAISITPAGDTHYVAWFPTQIKSATGNRGTWDPKDPDIRHNPQVLPFFSTCVNWPRELMPALTYLIENGQDLSRTSFLRNVDKEAMKDWEEGLGYGKWLRMKDDYAVSYERLKDWPVVWFNHSAIEHVFAEQNTIERLSEFAREQGP